MPIVADLASIRTIPSIDDEDDITTNEILLTVSDCVALLKSTDEADRQDGLANLAELCDTAYGEDGLRLGREVRQHGGVPLLAWLLSDPVFEVQQTALMVLGNLCSDAVDAHSAQTKSVLLPSARPVFSCAYIEEPSILCVACGCLQNLTSERAWAELAVSHDVHKRLEQLVLDDNQDASIKRYASGALQNISNSLNLMSDLSDTAREAVSRRSIEHTLEAVKKHKAQQTIHRAFLRIPEEKRRQRLERGLRRGGTAHYRRRGGGGGGAAETNCSDTSSESWSYEIGPFVRSRDGSRPGSACSNGSHASSRASSYLTASSLGGGAGRVRTEI